MVFTFLLPPSYSSPDCPEPTCKFFTNADKISNASPEKSSSSNISLSLINFISGAAFSQEFSLPFVSTREYKKWLRSSMREILCPATQIQIDFTGYFYFP